MANKPQIRGRLLFELALNDFHARYSGSSLGAVWSFVQPVLSILVYLFLYKVGFRSESPQAVPFVLWLIVGIAPWFYFVEGTTLLTTAFVEYSFLVKKVVFDVGMVPVVKLLSISIVHAVVWCLCLLVLLFSGITPSVGWALVPYYFFAMFALLLAMGRVTSLITPFFRDLGQIVGVVVQFSFWLTPVMWPIDNAPARWRGLIAMNPVFHVIDGLRRALLPVGGPVFDVAGAAAFWGIVLVVYAVGALMTARLRPHMADVL
jgi:teichoic acid transport system permease protein